LRISKGRLENIIIKAMHNKRVCRLATSCILFYYKCFSFDVRFCICSCLLRTICI